MLGGCLAGTGHLLVVRRWQRLHGGHGLLEEPHVVEAQADLLLQARLVLDPAGQVLLLDELLLLLLGSPVAQAGQGVPIPTHLLLRTALTALVAAHHVGVVAGVRQWWWWCGHDLARRLRLVRLLRLLGLVQPRTEEATLGLGMLGVRWP